MKNRKTQFHKDGHIWEYTVDGLRCDCGCNVFHKEYDGKNIFYSCNACNYDIATLKDEYVSETLNKGIWKEMITRRS